MTLFLRLLATLLFTTLPAAAHDLHFTVSGNQAVVVRLHYVNNAPFNFERYEVYCQDEEHPYQTGRTDRQGRIAFLPDRAGVWRIKVFSEDGHGLDFNVTTDAAARVAASDQPAYERYGRIVVGVALILGLFGILAFALSARRRRP
ncbi:MAG: hypothetical protein HZB71_11945 [Betaproteobacteria bacterium]|nr:hypothetical protein [Betaproteobacteria bacterium]